MILLIRFWCYAIELFKLFIESGYQWITPTIGSLYGACYGMKIIDPKWYKDLGREVHLFLSHKKVTTIDEVIEVALRIRNTI